MWPDLGSNQGPRGGKPAITACAMARPLPIVTLNGWSLCWDSVISVMEELNFILFKCGHIAQVLDKLHARNWRTRPLARYICPIFLLLMLQRLKLWSLVHFLYSRSTGDMRNVRRILVSKAEGSRSQWPRCLRPLKHWDRGFESHSRRVCLCSFILCLCCSVCR
jgi:hypothetical protein